MTLSIIIPTINRNYEISRLFDSIVTNIKNDFEIIVIDQNVNNDLTKIMDKYLSRFKIRHIRSRRSGVSFSKNIAISKAKGKFLFFADDDCVLEPYFIDNALQLLKENENIDLFFYNILNLENGKIYAHELDNEKDNALNIYNFDRIPSISFVVSKSKVVQTGGFDEMFGVGGLFGSCEESDLLFSLLKFNIKSKFVDNINIFHPSQIVNSRDKSNFPRIQGYAYGCGAFSAKCLLNTDNTFHRLVILYKFLRMLALSTFGYIIFYIDKNKKNHYRYSVKCKIQGFIDYYKYI